MTAARTPVVEVVWRDSWNLEAGWHDRRMSKRYVNRLPRQRTVGFVIRETGAVLVIASTLGTGRKCAAVVAIPKATIVKRRTLR